MANTEQHLRASDAERERVIEELRRHAADGRLTMDEFEQRVGEALAATTRGDLGPVLRELPALEPEPQPRRRPEPQPWRRMPLPSGRTLLRTVAVALAFVLVMQGMWWVIFPLMGVLGGCGRAGHCASGGAARHHTRKHSARHPGARGGAVDDRELIHV